MGGRGIVGLPGVAAKTFTAVASAHTNVLLISQSSSSNDICFVINSADTSRTVESLRQAFAFDLAQHQVEHIAVNPDIAIVAVVGDRMRGMPGIAGRTFSALGGEASTSSPLRRALSEYNVSLVVESGMMHEAVKSLHGEFALERRASRFETVKVEHALVSL